MKASTRHTGRAASVRSWLQSQRTAHTPAEIIAACDPGCTTPHMCATLAGMVEGGFLERIGGGKGKVKFQIAPVQPVRRPGPRPTGWQERRNLRRQARAEKTTVAAKPRTAPRPASQNPSRVLRTTPAPRRVQSTNFVAPLATVLDPNSAKRRESTQLAADLARFKRNGGRIERLPVGASADPLKHSHDR